MAILSTVSGLICAAPDCQAATDAGLLSQAGGARVVFDRKASTCDRDFIPDAPARAFRRADGLISLLAPHFENWQMLGVDFRHLAQSCSPVMASRQYAAVDPGRLWIEGVYTADGRTIYGIASEDLTVANVAAGCPGGGIPGQCWTSALVSVRSHDMGTSYAPDPGDGTLASIGTDWHSALRGRSGFFTISNILSTQGYSYAFFYFEDNLGKARGNCLARTANVEDPRSWRAWDGRGFTASLIASGRSRCKVVGDGILTDVRSLSYLPAKRLYIAVYGDRLKLAGDVTDVPGAYYSISHDLLTWSAPQRMVVAAAIAKTDSMDVIFSYPSLIDPNSRSRNFDTIDSDSPWLMMTMTHLSHGGGSMDRDLVYFPVQVSK